MTTFSKFAVNCAAMALFTIIGFSQVVTAISGTILGDDGKPAPNAEMKIIRTDIKGNYSIKTNKDGKYNYPTLPMGTYDVVVAVEGVDRYKVSNIKTDPGKPSVVDVDLSKVPAGQSGAADAGKAKEAGPTAEQVAEYEKQKKAYDEAQAKDASLQSAFTTAMEAARAKNWDVAIENFQKAGELDPKQDVVWAQLGDVYSMKAQTQKGAARTEDYGRAAEALKKAVELKPADAAYHNNLGLALARSQKMDQAQAEIAKAVQLDASKAGMYYRNLGRVYFDSNQTEPAEAAYKKAIEADPTNPDAHFQLGLSMLQRATAGPGDKLNAPEGTAEAFQQYLALAPTGANAEEAKAMLQVLGAPVATGFKGAAPQNNKGKNNKGK